MNNSTTVPFNNTHNATADGESRLQCEKDDATLERWTFIRFVVLAGIMLYRIYTIMRRGSANEKQRPEGHGKHPIFTKRMNDPDSFTVVRLFFAGLLFIQTEGVGLFIYFATSALLDNYTIYFVDNVKFCEYVMQVALYSMALVTFLPTVIIAYCLQGRLYDEGSWLGGGKIFFVVLMLVATVVSFSVRLLLVYKVGYDSFIDRMLKNFDYKVIVAILVPPVVDALQTMLLLMASIGPPEDHDYTDLTRGTQPALGPRVVTGELSMATLSDDGGATDEERASHGGECFRTSCTGR